MTYNRGTLAEFTTWHDAAKIAEDIPEGGKIGCVNGIPAPDNQRTMEYSEVIPHTVNADDYIWVYNGYVDGSLPSLTKAEAITAEFLPEQE